MHLVLLLFAGFASIFTFSKDVLNYSEPFFAIGSRMFIAGVVLLTHQLITNRKKIIEVFRPEHTKYLFLLGITSIYLTNMAEIWGIKQMVSSKACLLYSLSPFFAALVAYFMLGEKLNARRWLGIIIGFVGLIPVFFCQTYTEISSGTLWVFTWAELAILFAVLTSVIGWIILKKLMQFGYSPIFASAVSMLLGGSMALMHSYLAGEAWQPFPVNNYPAFLHDTFWMFLISNIICYNLYGHLLKTYTATFMSFAGLVTTFFAALFGWLFLNEIITWHYLVSVSLFSIGLTLFYLEEIKKGEAYKLNYA